MKLTLYVNSPYWTPQQHRTANHGDQRPSRHAAFLIHPSCPCVPRKQNQDWRYPKEHARSSEASKAVVFSWSCTSWLHERWLWKYRWTTWHGTDVHVRGTRCGTVDLRDSTLAVCQTTARIIQMTTQRGLFRCRLACMQRYVHAVHHWRHWAVPGWLTVQLLAAYTFVCLGG